MFKRVCLKNVSNVMQVCWVDKIQEFKKQLLKTQPYSNNKP